MTPAFVQGIGGQGIGVTTKSVVLGSNPVAGNLLVAWVGIDSGATLASFSSVADGAWTPASPMKFGGTNSGIQAFYVLRTAGGANATTITATTTGSSNIVIGVHEVSGFVNCQLDQGAAYRQDTVATTNVTTPVLTNLGAVAYYFAFDDEGSTTTSCSAPFTFRLAITGGHGTADGVFSTVTPQGCQFLTGSATHGTGTVVFSEASIQVDVLDGLYWEDERGPSDSIGPNPWFEDLSVFISSGINNWVQNLSDSITLTDAITSKAVVLLKTDSTTLVDAAGKAVGKPESDTITTSDAVAKVMGLNKGDSITLSDALIKAMGLGKSDTITLVEVFSRVFAALRSFDDPITLVDATAKAVGKPEADSFTLLDAIAKAMGLTKADAVSLADAVIKAMGLGKADSIVLTDVLNRTWASTLFLSDTITLSDVIHVGGQSTAVHVHVLMLDRFGIY